MKISGYLWRRLTEDVCLLQATTADLAMNQILSERLRPAGEDLSDDCVKDDRGRLRMCEFEFRTLQPRVVRGFLIYASVVSLARFLQTEVLRTGTPEIDAVLLSASSGRGEAEVREIVASMQTGWDLPFTLRPRRSSIPHPFLDRSMFSEMASNLRALTLQRDRWYFRSGGGGVVTFSLEDVVDVLGHRVPRRRFVACRTPEYEQDGGRLMVAYDGTRLIFGRGLDEIPASLRRSVEEQGGVEGGDASGLVLPPPGIEPIALVRVPSKREAEAAGPETVTPPDVGGNGLLVFDSRDPVPLPRTGPVIDDPRDALAIVSRVRRHLFVRNEPSMPGRAELRDEPYYVVLDRIR